METETAERKLAGLCGTHTFARSSRFLSPPDSTDTAFCWSPPLKLNQLQYALTLTSLPLMSMISAPSPISSKTVLKRQPTVAHSFGRDIASTAGFNRSVS